eukprot:11174765-Lingulodinium_polyedra.AAC.1
MDGVSASTGEVLVAPQRKVSCLIFLGVLSHMFGSCGVCSVHSCIAAGCSGAAQSLCREVQRGNASGAEKPTGSRVSSH